MNIEGLSKGYPNDAVIVSAKRMNTQLYQKGILVKGDTTEIVVEILGNHIGGLYITLSLTEFEKSYEKFTLRNMISAGIVGVMLVLLGSFIALYCLKDKSLYSLSLIFINLLMFVKICFENNYFNYFQNFIFFKEYITNTIFDIIIMFFPVIFLFCIQQMIQIKVQNKTLIKIFIYELILIPLVFIMAFSGLVHLKIYFCLLSCAPFLLIIIQLYKSIGTKEPHTLLISAILMLLITSAITSTVVRTGNLVIDISLIPPVFFTISLLLQLTIYISRNLELQNQAFEAEKLQIRLKEREFELMLSQIKPHFMYNTLLAIHMLCTEEPETAAETVLKFSSFLRTNMKFIGSKESISFKNELIHIKNYVDIEKLRFQNRLEVQYDIEIEDFFVPPLTIQPLVENAIRHGVCKKIDNGLLILKTRSVEEGVCIEIIDNGPGFDTSIINLESNKHHGINNVIFRLNHRNIKIHFKSEPNEGCTVSILVHKDSTIM